MPRVLGVDVSLGRGLDVALVEDAALTRTWSRVGPGGLAGLLLDEAPDAVAIDAPPRPGLGLLRHEGVRRSLPVPPEPGRHLDRRVAEYELARRGIGSHQTHHDESKLFSWMTAGFEAFAAARAAGYPPFLGEGDPAHRALEAFPYAGYVALAGCLSPGRRVRLPWRRAVLEAAGLRGLPEDATIDLVDAACAGLVGVRVLSGEGSWVGHPQEGAIVLPVPRLADRYRRCAAPNAPPRPPAAAERLCECGCGAPARRRFLPGHDARLRARLLHEARAGRAAADELRRLGWEHFLEGD